MAAWPQWASGLLPPEWGCMLESGKNYNAFGFFAKGIVSLYMIQ
jgi:hypothetical protein